MHLVHLGFAQTENKVRRAAVTGAAFGPARKTPDLFPNTARSARVLDDQFFLVASFADECRVGLVLVPSVGVGIPLAVETGEQPGLDAPARSGVARLALERKRLDEHGAVCEIPTSR